mmetsp:Transcript_46191/g.100363  ORF Transcript_46191/g.100363 Transcript_46191/m.100363 type:complete len:125 (-) Transcript_46191:129-503(-)|eukprot:CAMPEP_0170619862 /NCGR_PEP_ID=MMETSP0224-20130122/27742_1 /TAXON_ID=285029 /ORGANISM="Togula jolla, Strain CCCM 725" /LENGTH=124 /DNA_ID=CAMNT_0010945979 /DNA_START=136 /DNA_END=510 /DNA_ORIENTATION=+
MPLQNGVMAPGPRAAPSSAAAKTLCLIVAMILAGAILCVFSSLGLIDLLGNRELSGDTYGWSECKRDFRLFITFPLAGVALIQFTWKEGAEADTGDDEMAQGDDPLFTDDDKLIFRKLQLLLSL